MVFSVKSFVDDVTHLNVENEDNGFVHSFGQFELYYEKYDAEFR